MTDRDGGERMAPLHLFRGPVQREGGHKKKKDDDQPHVDEKSQKQGAQFFFVHQEQSVRPSGHEVPENHGAGKKKQHENDSDRKGTEQKIPKEDDFFPVHGDGNFLRLREPGQLKTAVAPFPFCGAADLRPDNEEGQTDREQILWERDVEILKAGRSHEPSPCFVANKCPDHRTSGAQDNTRDWRLVGRDGE